MKMSVLGFGILSLLLTACGGEPEFPDVTGPYTATGTIVGTGSSLHRRGTHILLMNGRKRFFLESKKVNLGEFENQLAQVQGDVSPNTHASFLPVMQVNTVTPVEGGGEQTLQRYTMAALGLALEAPQNWKNSVKDGRLTFTHPEEEDPFVAIERSEAALLPLEGIPIRIDGNNGVREIDEETSVHRVYIKLSAEEIILFTYGPKGIASHAARDAFYSMLQSVDFDERAIPEEPEDPGEETGSLQPCGGPAAVLCPEGEYCAVQEIETGIGVCKAL